MRTLNFNRCLAQIRKGDLSGLQWVYDEYHEKMIITAKLILHNDFLAEDAVSDTYMNIIRFAKEHKRPNITNPGAYLFTAVKRAALRICLENKRFTAIDLSEECAAELIDHIEAIDLERELKNLGNTDAKIADLFYFYGYKITEIADELNMPEGTVKWKLFAIRNDLYEKLKKL